MYCPIHEELLAKCILECSERREQGHLTCSNPVQRSEELSRTARPKRRKPSRQTGADEEGERKGNQRQKKKKGSKGVFCRKWTHNEQLMVRPCGVVIGRSTFYQSESLPGVKVRRRRVFNIL